MPYPTPLTYPSELLFPGTTVPEGQGRSPIALGDLVFNIVDQEGTVWAIEDNPDWSGSPASTSESDQRARDHGATASEGFYEPKTLSMSGRIRANDARTLSRALDQLNAAVSLDPFQLAVAESGRVRHMTVKRQDGVISGTVKGSSTLAAFSFQVMADDPLKYGDLVTDSTLLPSSVGGLIRPSTWPRMWAGVSTSGKILINNDGNAQAPVWLRIDGPMPAGGWTVRHVGKKRSLAFATSLALEAGEFVTVDMKNREVMAQGQSARAGYVTARGWFSLDPGLNEISFSATNHSPTARLTLTTKPAWS